MPDVLKSVKGYIRTIPAGTSLTFRFRVSARENAAGITVGSVIADDAGWSTQLRDTIAASGLPDSGRIYQDQKEIETA